MILCLSVAGTVQNERGSAPRRQQWSLALLNTHNSEVRRQPRRQRLEAVRVGRLLRLTGSPPQELAGYTGGDVSFIKEDFELQLNKQLVFDSVSIWPGSCHLRLHPSFPEPEVPSS